jgi:hypothetical protein
MSPRGWGYLSDQCQSFGVTVCFVSGQQLGQYRGVVIADRIGNQPCTLVTDFDLYVGMSGQFLLSANFRDGCT